MPRTCRFVVYLVKPSKYDDEGFVIRYWRGVLPSNTLACLYGLTEDVRERRALGPLTWRIELLDESVQKVDVPRIIRVSRRRDTKVVVCLVGVQSNQFARASDLALALRAGGVEVLIGGFHVSGSLAMLPQTPPEIQRLLDAGVTVVAGEVEGRWEGILRDALQGTLRPVYNFLLEPPALEQAPLPRVTKRYLRRFVAPNFSTVDCGRGCPFACSFCTVINVQGRTMRVRDVGRLTALIRENYRRHRISYYFFTDDNFCRNKHWAALCEALIRLRREEGIHVAFMIQVDTQAYRVPGFVEKIKAAGCTQVFIGLESLNPQNLAAAGKRQNRVADFRAMVAAYRAAGINTHVAYIIGFPFDTLESVRQDVERLTTELGPEQASFFMLTPLPGSQDHLELVRRSAPMDRDLNRYDSFHVTTPHPRMSRTEWQQAYDEAWRTFYGIENLKAVLRRVPPANYWGVLTNAVWYKNATMVEEGHPMLHGFVRLKDRLQRRPGFVIESRWRHLRRRLRDAGRYLRLWTRLALEMEEVWLQTRPRSELERLVIQELKQRYAHMRQWRELRLTQLQQAYCRAVVRLKRRSREKLVARQAIPSRAWLWVQQRNPFACSLTHSRQSLQRRWQDTWTSLRRGRLHQVSVGTCASNFIQEAVLFLTFARAYFTHLAVHLFGHVAESRR